MSTVQATPSGAPAAHPARIAITRAVSPTLAQCALMHLERKPIDVAVITRLGAAARRPETAAVAKTLAAYRALHVLAAPGTLDGGDILQVGRNLYVGLSGRSNAAGIAQLRAIVTRYGYIVVLVPFSGCLHLKSAVTQVGPETLLGNRAWVSPEVFAGLGWLDVAPEEPRAGNALLVGDTVLFPQAYPETAARLTARGITVQTVNVSELAKAEGGVTCCSLIFTTRDAASA